MASKEVNALNAKGKMQGLWRAFLLIAVITVVLILARVFGFDKRLGDLRDWIETLGAWGYVVFAILYVVATVAGIPGTPITVAAGAIFGSVLGIILVSISSLLGAISAFLIARYFARDAIAHWLSTKEKFRQIDQLTERNGAIIVALTRLMIIFPFSLLNYGFGLTRVKFLTYVFWSWLCMLPGTALYVVGADAITSGISQGRVSWLLIGVVTGVGIILIILTHYARRRLKESEIKIKIGDVAEHKERF